MLSAHKCQTSATRTSAPSSNGAAGPEAMCTTPPPEHVGESEIRTEATANEPDAPPPSLQPEKPAESSRKMQTETQDDDSAEPPGDQLPSRSIPTPSPATDILPSSPKTNQHVPTDPVTLISPASLPPSTATLSYASITSQRFNSNKTYQPKTNTSPGPTKNNAIILPFVQGLFIDDYLSGLCDIIPPREILYASRISNDRVCVYLSCEKSVHDAIQVGYIKTKMGHISLRRMINRTERLTLSNVMPSIPNDKLLTAITDYVDAATPIQYVTAGSKDPRLQHVRSFKRELHIQRNEKLKNLPASFLLKHEGEETRIFLTLSNQGENSKCYKCKSTDHKAKDCRAIAESVNTRLGKLKITDQTSTLQQGTSAEMEITEPSYQLNIHANTSEIQNKTPNELNDAPNSNNHPKKMKETPGSQVNPTEGQQKVKCTTTQETGPSRPKNDVTSPMIVETEKENPRKRNTTSPLLKTPNKKEAKKQPTVTPKKLDPEQKEIARAVKNSMQICPEIKIGLSSAEITTMLTETKDSKHPVPIIQKYTSDLKSLANFLSEVETQRLPRKTKARLSRLVKALRTEESSTSGEESDCTSLDEI